MKPGIPWSVKGIDSEAREAAKHAARRSGMTLGEWLNTVILDKSADEPPPRDERRPRQRSDDLSIQLGDLAQQLARLSQREQDTSAGHYHEQAGAPEPSHEIAGQLLSRIETSERQTADAFSTVNDRLIALNRQIAELPSPVSRADPADSPAFHALESALRNVVDHIEVSERRTRDTIKGMQDRVTAMALRAASAESDAVSQTAPAIERLEGRLAGMADRLERTEAAAQRDLPGLVQGELKRLGERIEGVKAASDATAQRTQSATQRELREMEGRIHTLFADAQTQMRNQGGSAAEYQALRGEIEGLAQRFDDLKADSASERDLNGLRLAVEQLSARIAQGPDLRPFADMDRRLADLTKRLEQGNGDPRWGSQLGDLESRVHDLDRRLADASRQGDDGRAADALHKQLDAIAERIEGTERQLGHIVTLDRSVSQLYESIEQSRAFAREAAEDAAGRMAERLMQMQPQQPGVPSQELQALQQGLVAVRASAADADRRNQETLEAVHETLEQIVNRLADMESRGAQPAPAQPQSAWQPPPVEPQTAWQPPADLPREPIFPPEPQTPVFAPIQQPAAAPPAVPDFADLPPEPEQQFPRDDFIAAARRAAQAAAQRQAHPLGNGAGLKPSGLKLPGVPRFSWPFSGRKAARNGPAPVANGGKKDKGSSRRRLILAGLVLLAAVSAFTFGNLYKKPAPAPAPPAMEQKAPEVEPSGAKPPQPRPSGSDTGMPVPESLTPQPESRKSSAMVDGMVTGALPVAKQDATLASIVAEPGTTQPAPNIEIAPPEAGPESLRRAAAEGDPVAQFVLAGRYLDGKDVEQDFTEAARWYQQAANSGLAPAQYRIATLFERGRGVPQDVAAARIWYERAAERGNVKAMHNAAVISAGKQAGNPEYARAAKWFAAAAQHGLKDSQFNLAVLYERGMGVAPDQGEALFWYSLAGRQNDTDALAKAAVIEQGLAPAAVDAVKARLSSWKAAEALPRANVVAIPDPQWQASLAPAAAKTALTEVASAHAEAAPAGEEQNIVLRTQELLSGLGFNVGTPDGKMGSRTANAIRLFELQQGLKVTGQPTPELLSQLEAKSG